MLTGHFFHKYTFQAVMFPKKSKLEENTDIIKMLPRKLQK
jgi:hypothetical protein